LQSLCGNLAAPAWCLAVADKYLLHEKDQQ
jgi:hypothetical protein